jgi:hypothetical protein
MRKRLVSLILSLFLILSLIALGCGSENITAAEEPKLSGDEMAGNVANELREMAGLEYSLRQAYVESLRNGEPRGVEVMAEIEQGYANILFELEGAREEYHKILKLGGMKDYKAYAKEMLAFLDALEASIEASLDMDRGMDQVQALGPLALDAEAVAVEINDRREEAIQSRREASSRYTAAYLLDRDKLHPQDAVEGLTPGNIHLSWTRDPQTSITVHWETPRGMTGYVPTVEFGTDSESMTDFPVGETSIPPYGNLEQHQVELVDLVPDTIYFFRCGSPGYGWSEVRSFRTPPTIMEGFSFCAVGDTRSASGKSSDVSAWREVAAAASAEHPLFTLLLGGLVYSGFEEDMWTPWMEAAQPLLERGAVMSAHGNHEEYAVEYFDRFSLPANQRWYSFDVGNIHFVCLDSGLMDYYELPLLEEQTAWLERDLEEASQDGMLWTVVFLHRPPYSSGAGYGDQPDIIREWVPVFDRFGVDLVLASHDHFYQRSFPMREGEATSDSVGDYRSPGGTIYILQGCGGAPLSEPVKAEWTASQGKDFSYTTVRLLPGDGNLLEVATKKIDGGMLDRFFLSK